MTKIELVKEIMNKKEIYITSYGQDKDVASWISTLPVDKIENIRLNCTYDLPEKPPYFTRICGGPGPDVVVYYLSDYGRTWAFSKEELEKENCSWRKRSRFTSRYLKS